MGAAKDAPRWAINKKTITLQYLFDLDSGLCAVAGSPTRLPPSAEAETDELVSMISYCSHVFTFTDPSESPVQQELKRLKLSKILSALRSPKRPFIVDNDQIFTPLVGMLSANLFRSLPPPAYPCIPSDPAEDETTAIAFAPSWPHLHIVYDILATILANASSKSLRSHLDRGFLLSLVSLFQSEDPRERDRLKNVYHHIYSRLTSERSFMRKSMSNVLLHFAGDTERHCGIGELLEIWGSIINGFTVPLKEEHKRFLVRVLVPLHRHKGMHGYHRQLSYCVSQFVEKEPVLAGAVVRGILKYWPVTNCQKEVLLIGELEDLVESMPPEQLEKVAVTLCSQIAKCLRSSNSQVAERALYAWNNESFVRMVSQSMGRVLPEVVDGLEKNMKWHWSKSVQELTASVKKMLEEMEPGLYSECLYELRRRESMAVEEEMKRKERWERLELAAAKMHLHQQRQQPNCVTA